MNEVISNSFKVQQNLQDMLAIFKNNRINTPYIKEIAGKSYWFVNGKNTGAIAQDETTSQDDLKKEIISSVLNDVYSKEEVNKIGILENYYTKEDINNIFGSDSDSGDSYATRNYVDDLINKLREELKIYTQS